MGKSIFIVGTGTDVGKTYITALIVKKLREAGKRAAYFKAAASGNVRTETGLIPGDAYFVKKISGIDMELTDMIPYVYENAVSPHLASRMEGNPVNLEVIKEKYQELCHEYDYITMEGSGGILCPVCFDEKEIWLEDIIKMLGLSSVLIDDAGLGTINAAVLTIEYMKQKGMPVKGIICNHCHPGDPMEEDNKRMIEHRCGVPVIGCVADGADNLDIPLEKLIQLYE